MARCPDDPNGEIPKSRSQGSVNNRKGGKNNTKVHEAEAEMEENEENLNEDYVHNHSLVPYVVGKFLGCDVTLDEDEILRQCRKKMQHKEMILTSLMQLRQQLLWIMK